MVHNDEIKNLPPTLSSHVHSTPGHNSQQEQRIAARAPSRAKLSYSMSDPSITVAEAFKQFSQVTVSAVGPGSTLAAFSSFIQLFQHHSF